ncbi:uncharacterized protein ISCGN_008978 [Ixodes scapularis]
MDTDRRTTLGQGQQERFEGVHAQLTELVRQSEADRTVISLLAQRIESLENERQIEAASYTRLERRMEMQVKEPTEIEEEDTVPEAKGESIVPTTAGQEQAQDNMISPGRQEDKATSPGCKGRDGVELVGSWNKGDRERKAKDSQEHSAESSNNGEQRSAGVPVHLTEPRRTRVPTQPTQQKRAGSTPMRPPKGVKREVIVAGDGNVGRFASALVQEVGVKDSVEFLYQRAATVDQAHEAIREYEGQARKLPRKYVLHLGLNEVLQGTVEDLMAKLEETWKGRGAELVICSIPEVSSRGKEMQAGARIRAMCVRIKARFLDMEPTKMAKADKRLLEDLKEAGREAPRKFWRHVRDQTGKPREDPMLKDDTTGRQLGPRETI